MKSLSNVAASTWLSRARTDQLALLLVLSLALIVRFYAIAVPSIWYDEAYSLLLARETPTRIWALTALDVHPPLYYVLLHYWVMLWGEGALQARALSALADVGTLLLCIKLMSLIATRRATWIAALLLALLPMSVRYSQEARMYTLLGFWLMGATVALVCWVKAPEQNRFAVLYVMLMTAAFYSHYFAGLCVLVHWLFWWHVRSVRNGAGFDWQNWLFANIAIMFLYLPWLPNLLRQLADTSMLGWIEPVTLRDALMLVWQFTIMGDVRSLSTVWLVIPFAAALSCAVAIVASSTGERCFNGLLASYFFLPLTVLYLVSLVHPFFVPRYLVFSAPALMMIVAVALDIFWEHRARLAGVAFWCVVVAMAHGLSSVYRQSEGLNGSDKRRNPQFGQLMEQLNREARSDDEIVIADPYLYPTFIYFSTTGIDPRLEAHSSIDDFLALTSRGVFGLMNDPAANAYIDGVTILDCHRRIWWIMNKDLHADRPLFARTRTPSLVIDGEPISAYLFTPGAVSASPNPDTDSKFKPPLHPAAQNCPP